MIFGGCGANRADRRRGNAQKSPAAVAPPRKVIGPAVAGLFYPRHEKDLAELVDKLLAEARSAKIENLRGLVCPDAGYEFSGKTAAIAYKQLLGRNIHTAIILGPSHYAWFEGAALPSADAMETPLGLVRLSPKTAALAKRRPFVVDPPAEVERPAWWSQSPQRELPPFGEETPFTWEHSVEDQLPFLQRVLAEFRVVPAVMHQVDPEAAADALLPLLDDETILIASSDLTHFLPYETAMKLDNATIRTICEINPDRLEQEEQAARAVGSREPAVGLREAAHPDTHARRPTEGLEGGPAGLSQQRRRDRRQIERGRLWGDRLLCAFAGGGRRKPAAAEKRQFSAAQRKFLLDLARRLRRRGRRRQSASDAAGGDAKELADDRRAS